MTLFESARQADVIAAAEKLGLTLRRSGGKAYACCLFHADKNPSMCLYPDGHFYCFTCHAHGDAANLYMQALGLGAREAAERVCRDFGLAWEDAPRGGSRRPRTGQAIRPRATPQQAHRAAQRTAGTLRERRVTQLMDAIQTAQQALEKLAVQMEGSTAEEILADGRFERLVVAQASAQIELDALDAMDDAQLGAWAKEQLRRMAETEEGETHAHGQAEHAAV